jgi:type IV pilus biogenesis protein CpaD/CtpE
MTMSRTRKIGVPSALLLAALALAGCAQIDPFQREGIWKPSSANDANLAAMVANPADLSRGREDARGTIRTPTTAVDRLWAGAPAQRPAQSGGIVVRPASEAPR